MTHPLVSVRYTTHICSKKFLVVSPAPPSATTTPNKYIEMSCAQTPVCCLELGHLATGDYSSCPPALGTDWDTVFMRWLVAIPEYTGNQQTEAVRALGASLYLGPVSCNYSRTCSKSARTQNCDSHTRAAHTNHRQCILFPRYPPILTTIHLLIANSPRIWGWRQTWGVWCTFLLPTARPWWYLTSGSLFWWFTERGQAQQ